MIDDLLDLTTDANILLIGEEYIESIVDLLKANHFQSIQYSNNLQAAMAVYLDSQPDLIIVSSLKNIPALEIASSLTTDESENIPPFLLIKENNSSLTLDSVIKDFITLPINNEELLFRVNQLISSYFSWQELRAYNQSIVTAIDQRNKELKDTQMEIIECLGHASEFRDSETGMHTIRVGHYSQCLAKAIGMSDKEAESLLYSAPMHDVGKIGIPDKILLKPGQLDEKEWKIMKSHANIGESILSRSNNKLLKQASIIAATHHEKWDGSGYPKGLRGNDIHLYGRIVAIADVFDALTMDRPYKKAWSLDCTIEFIISKSGKHFDPTLVNLFTKNIEKFLVIKETYTDKESSKNLLNEYVSV